MTKERFSNQTVLNSNKERTAKFAPTLPPPPPTSKEVVTGPRTLKTSPRALKIHQNFRAAKYDINQRSDLIRTFLLKNFSRLLKMKGLKYIYVYLNSNLQNFLFLTEVIC